LEAEGLQSGEEDGCDYMFEVAGVEAGVEVVNDSTHGLSGNLQEEFQQRAVSVEERSQEVIGGESDVQMGHIEYVLGDIVDPVVHADLAAGRAEASFTGEGDTMLILAAMTDPTCIATIGVTAEQHTLNNVPDVSLLIEGIFVGQREVAVALPVVEEYLAEAIITGWVIKRLPGGASLILKEWWVFDGEVSGYCVTGKNMQ
jgi:hypothetical protein